MSRYIDITIEHDIGDEEYQEIFKELNGKTNEPDRIILSNSPYRDIRFPEGLNCTRTHDDYSLNYKDRKKLHEIRAVPITRTVRLTNIEDEENIFRVLEKHGIKKLQDEWYNESPFHITGAMFRYVEIDSVEDDLKQELRYHHGDGSLYGFGATAKFETSEVKREFIDWLDATIPHSWFYEQNWNYVSYIAVSEGSIKHFRNPKTADLFSDEIKEQIKKNGACIVAAMVCTKTGIKTDNGFREYVRIEDIITRVCGIKLSRLLFYEYMKAEEEWSENDNDWVDTIKFIPGKIVGTGVSFWFHMLASSDMQACISSHELIDAFDFRVERLSKKFKKYELDYDWGLLSEFLACPGFNFDSSLTFERLNEFLCDDCVLYYRKSEFNDKLIILQLEKDEPIDSKNEWRGPIEIKRIPKNSIEDTGRLELEYYNDRAIFKGSESIIESIFNYLETIESN